MRLIGLSGDLGGAGRRGNGMLIKGTSKVEEVNMRCTNRANTGWPSFNTGVVGNGADFTGSQSVCYSLSDNFALHAGTLEFWVKPPPQEPLRFFDIGTLGLPNSWGIFLNSNHVIMEVKNQYNEYAQAWSPEPIGFDGG
jgi:hypothetical protein